uniref:Alternative protein FAM169A n=1 Tax=Homo sapiens TaxID=9606 RepID=L8E885_HUMAN|nr:alternative protein FAM169A [Homo sapiens]
MRSHSCVIAVLIMLRFCGRKERPLGFIQLSLQEAYVPLFLPKVTNCQFLIQCF